MELQGPSEVGSRKQDDEDTKTRRRLGENTRKCTSRDNPSGGGSAVGLELRADETNWNLKFGHNMSGRALAS